jgi:hypothetical protein
MNSNCLLAPRSCWTRTLAVAVITLLALGSAFASPATNIAPTSMFRPRGMVRVTIPNPAGGAPITDYWASDGANGFCRLDGPPGKALLNISTCFIPGTGEPFADPQLAPGGFTSFVFVADESGSGVNRFTFKADPTNPTKTAIATVENVLGPGSGLIPFLGKVRATSAKIGPDGKLYVVFFQNGDIWRVTNPRAPIAPGVQRLEFAGESSNGKRYFSMAFIGNDFWGVQAGFLERIQNITSCFGSTISCVGRLEIQNIQLPVGMISDGVRYLTFWNGNRLVRMDTFSTILRGGSTCPAVPGGPSTSPFTILTTGGIIPPSVRQTGFALPRGLNQDPATGDILITDDETIEAPIPEVASPLVRTGRAWVLPANPAPVPECGIIDSPAGTGTPLTPNPTRGTAATRGILRVAGATHPRGFVFVGTHFWVSDEKQGFCRIDPTGVGSAATLTNCFKPSPGFIPGQPAMDAPPLNHTTTTNIYLPDVSGGSAGILRFVFNPATETISQTGILSQGRNVSAASALAIGPEGSLYVGPATAGNVTRILTPATAPSAAITVAATLNGQGVRNMVFNGVNLYMTEDGAPEADSSFPTGSGETTLIQAAAPDLQRGKAIFFSGLLPFQKGTTIRKIVPPDDIDTPTGLTLGPTSIVPCQTRVSNFPPESPSLYLGGASEVDQWSFLCGRDTLWTDAGQFSALLPDNAPIGLVTALGFAPDGTLAIGDDPSLLPNKGGLKATTTAPVSGQGHVYVVLAQ